jgi:ribosomal protein S18 acetylase RimI-like enzyme
VRLVPDRRRRARITTIVVRTLLATVPRGVVLGARTPDGSILGAAILANAVQLRPRQLAPLLPLLVSGSVDGAWLLVNRPGLTLGALRRTAKLARLRTRLPPHRHLALLGVRPSAQRRGIGSALLAEALRHCDRAGTGCALETNRAQTRDWYARFGFRTVAEVRWEASETWLMYRPLTGATARPPGRLGMRRAHGASAPGDE